MDGLVDEMLDVDASSAYFLDYSSLTLDGEF